MAEKSNLKFFDSDSSWETFSLMRHEGLYEDSVVLFTKMLSLAYIHKKGALCIEDFSSTLSENDPLYDVVVKHTRNDEKIEDGVFMAILKCVLNGEMSYNEFVEYLDELVTGSRRYVNSAPTGQPKEFAFLAKELLDVEGKSVFNPFSGMMSFASTFEGYSSYTGVEIHDILCDYAKLRLALLDKYDDRVNVVCGDVAAWTDERYDVIVTNPPLGLNMQMSDNESHYKEDSVSVALKRFAETTNANGQMLTFCNLSLLFSTRNASLREELTRNNYLDAVIELPANILASSSIPLAVVLLNKNRQDGEPIKFVDASEMYRGKKERVLNVDEIVKSLRDETDRCQKFSVQQIADQLWSWNFHFLKSSAEETVREGFTQLQLSDILEEVSGDKKFSESAGRILRAAELPSDPVDYIWSLDDAPISDIQYNVRKFTSPVLMFMTIKGRLRFAYCEASEEKPLFAPNTLLACRVTIPDIHIGYLCMELSKKFIPTSGVANVMIERQLFFLLKVDFPSYQEQVNLFEEAKRTALIAKAREMGLEGVIEKMKEDYINEVRMRKHDMMGHLQQLSSARKNLDYYLTHKQEFTEDDFMAGMRHEVFNQKEAIESLTLMLEIFSRESQFGTPEKINIDDFLSNNYSDGDNYTVDNETYYDVFADCGFEIEEELLHPTYVEGMNVKEMMESSPDYAKSLNVFMAKDDLKRLFDNIIGNAVKHGFTNPENDYYIRTTLTFDRERKMYRIDVFNNGTPMPENMDKTRYGLRGEKGGVTAGTGEGGYIVKSIVEHYGGDYDIDSNEKGTTITVYLPYYIDDEN